MSSERHEIDIMKLIGEAVLWQDPASYDLIPDYTREALDRYKAGVPVGDFLTAVLSNDLMGACGRADVNNQRALIAIVSYCYNEMPGNCWGSPEKVAAWLARARAEMEAQS